MQSEQSRSNLMETQEAIDAGILSKKQITEGTQWLDSYLYIYKSIPKQDRWNIYAALSLTGVSSVQ